MREKREIGGGKWEEDRTRRKEKKTRDHFLSIFQCKKEASTSFWERRVTGSENAAVKLWQATVCRLTLEEKDRIKERERNERQCKGGREGGREVEVAGRCWKSEGDGGIEAWPWRLCGKGKYFIIEKLRLKWERFSLYVPPSYKSESSPTHDGRIERDKRIYYEQVPLFVDVCAYVRV